MVDGLGTDHLAGLAFARPGASYYFVVYLFMVITFVFGAASPRLLAVDAAFPNVLPVWACAALHGGQEVLGSI